MAISSRLLLLLSFLCFLSQTACAVTETVPCEVEVQHPMYQNGFHSVATLKVKKGGALRRPLLVAIPRDAGRYPVVQFQHGYLLQNSDFTGLISQVASWGFIVVAPQMYGFWTQTDVTTEITYARSILNWMKTGLIASLPTAFANHRPDFDKVALAGHSRGGHVVFGLALTDYGSASQQYSAIVGLDPVDGKPPRGVLTHKANSLDVGVPTLVVGTGLGPTRKKGRFPPCAPQELGHDNFYTELTPPSFHFVTTNNGHMDFLDDCKGWRIALRCFPGCRAGPSRQCMRQFSAGIVVAFLQDVLFHNNTSLSAALTRAVKAPVDVDPPECKGNISCSSEALQYADI